MHFLRQAAHVVVSFYGRRGAAHRARFDDIGVEGALHQPIHGSAEGFHLARLFFEDSNEFVADDLAFFFRIADASQLGEEASRCIHGKDIQSQPVT